MSESESSELRTVEPIDAEEIRAALGGDHAAYGRLIERHQEAIGAYLWRFTRDPTIHEELVQELFVEAYFGLRGYRGEGRFPHWLKRIATRVGYRYWKRRERDRRHVPLQDDVWSTVSRDGASQCASNEAAQIVHSVLERLPPRDRLVLTLLYLQGHSVAEAAELSGWTRMMVKVQAFRARGKLKRLLEQAGQ
jgi:RNA polymerase sigma-70 factor (ECF subfamily)